MLMLKIVNADRSQRSQWHKSEASNPDDALQDLARRGLYDFDAGDTLKKVVTTSDTEFGQKIDCDEFND